MTRCAPYVKPELISEYLFSAVESRDLRGLSQLFRNPQANPNCVNIDGQPLLVCAAKKGFVLGIKKILAQPHAKVNIRDLKGRTALHITAKKGNTFGLKMLVKAGGFKNIRDRDFLSPLHCAVEKGRIEVVDYLVNDPEGEHKHLNPVNINAVAYSGMTPLLIACYKSHLPMVRMLIKAGARINCIGADGYTAKAYALLYGWDWKIVPQIPMDSYTREFIKRKVLAHCNGIGSRSQIDWTTFPLDGAFSPYMHQIMHNQMQKYFQYSQVLSESQQKEILEAFVRSASSTPPREVVSRIQQNKLTVVQAGWKGHSIDLVFYGDYLAICNRGEGITKDKATIEVVKIDRDLVTDDVIAKIYKQKSQSYAESFPFFYFDLLNKLTTEGEVAPIKDELCKKISEFAPKPIKAGTCTYAAAKAAARCSMMFVAMNQSDSSDYHSLAALYAKEAKLASLFGRITALTEYLHFHFQQPHPIDKKPMDRTLIETCFWKIRWHVNKKDGYFRQLFESKIEELMSNYPDVFLKYPPGLSKPSCLHMR